MHVNQQVDMSELIFQSSPRILLCESQVLVRQGLHCLLESKSFRVVAEASDSCECLARAYHIRPDLVITDSQSCNSEDLAKLQKTFPAMKVIVLTNDDGVGQGPEVERLGYALVSKNTDVATLSGVIRRVCGETERGSFLRARDWEVLQLLATGKTNKEIGSVLGLAEKTVRYRLTEIFASIGVRNRTEAALYALGHRNLGGELQLEESATLAGTARPLLAT